MNEWMNERTNERMNDPGGPMWDWAGMLFIRPLKDAILKQAEKAGWRASPRLSHWSFPPPLVFYVATMYTNQIEATMLRVDSTNEKAGYNPLIMQYI